MFACIGLLIYANCSIITLCKPSKYFLWVNSRRLNTFTLFCLFVLSRKKRSLNAHEGCSPPENCAPCRTPSFSCDPYKELQKHRRLSVFDSSPQWCAVLRTKDIASMQMTYFWRQEDDGKSCTSMSEQIFPKRESVVEYLAENIEVSH